MADPALPGTALAPRSRIAVLYNIDYDAGSGAADAVSVAASAEAVGRALRGAGFDAELVGLAGRDALSVIDQVRGSRPDLVFNLCESLAGDARHEPTLVGLLDLFDLPYTGSDLLGLASCLHKQRAKEILIAHRIPTPPYRLLGDAAALADPALDQLDYPWFVKLAHEDASIGITEANLVETAAALRARASALIAQYRQPVLAERYVDGRELNVTLIGNAGELEVLPLHEIDFAAMPGDRPKIVSYAAKWDEAHVDYAGTKAVPLRGASSAMVADAERIARAAWTALGLRDYGRVDLRIDAADQPWVIDINPNPDISPDAGVARAAGLAGLSYPQLIARLAEVAQRRIQSSRR
jgi:D-alanine-D-alanine ligase